MLKNKLFISLLIGVLLLFIVHLILGKDEVPEASVTSDNLVFHDQVTADQVEAIAKPVEDNAEEEETAEPRFRFASDLTSQNTPAPAASPSFGMTPAAPASSLHTQVAGAATSSQVAAQTQQNSRRSGGGGSGNSSSNGSNTTTTTTTTTTNPNTTVGTTTATSTVNTQTGTSTATSTDTGGGTPTATTTPESNQVTDEEANALAANQTCDPLAAIPLNDELFSFLPRSTLTDFDISASTTTQRGYDVRTCGNVSLVIKWENKLPVQTVMLIEGNLNPLRTGPWTALNGSTVTDTILYSVAPGSGGSALSANLFPTVLETAINRSYGGTLSLNEGQHATAALSMEGLLKDVLVSMRYPTDNLTILAGQATPPVSVQTGAGAVVGSTQDETSFSDGLLPTYYVELTHRGTWSNAAGITDLALVDSTVYYDNSNNFGFWGVGTFKNTQFATFYNGPLAQSKDPRDYLAAQIGFGSESMSLPLYVEFLTAYNSRYANVLADGTGLVEVSDTTYAGVSASLSALPLEVITVDHPILSTLVFNSGDSFPGLQYFNAAIIGPLAKTKDGTNGPQTTLFGEGVFFKSTMGTIDLAMTASSAVAAMTGSAGINLGSAGGYDLGSLGGGATLTINATESSQAMTLESSFAAGPFGGQSITIDFNPTQANFARAATCALPLGVSGYATLTNPSSMSLSDLVFIPTVAIPDPAVLLECPEDIFFMAKDGVVLAFNSTVKLMEFADSFLPENEFTKIGIDGFKFAGGTLINAPEDLLALSQNVPGVSEALDAAADAKKALEDAAAEAQRQAEEAARLAAQAAQAAVGAALNFTNDLLQDPAGVLNDIFGAIGGTVDDFFNSGDQGPVGFTPWINRTVDEPTLKAKDISLSHGNVDWVWAVNVDGHALQFERLDNNQWNWWIRASGLPSNYGGFVHIDADPAGGAVGITTKGEMYTRTSNGNWSKANGYAVDVGIGGGYIWITSTEPDAGGFKIYRSTYYSGQTEFTWQDMQGSGVRIDVGGDGDAWTINNTYRVYEHTNGGWHDRRGVALDITVSKAGTTWIAGTNISHYGGQIHSYFPIKNIGFSEIRDYWEPSAGHAITIGAGAEAQIWAVNSFDDIYEASGRP